MSDSERGCRRQSENGVTFQGRTNAINQREMISWGVESHKAGLILCPVMLALHVDKPRFCADLYTYTTPESVGDFTARLKRYTAHARRTASFR